MRHVRGHALSYRYLSDRVLIKTYLPKELPCVPRQHEAQSMPIAFSQLDKGSRKTIRMTCNVGFCNEHLGHEEGNEARRAQRVYIVWTANVYFGLPIHDEPLSRAPFPVLTLTQHPERRYPIWMIVNDNSCEVCTRSFQSFIGLRGGHSHV